MFGGFDNSGRRIEEDRKQPYGSESCSFGVAGQDVKQNQNLEIRIVGQTEFDGKTKYIVIVIGQSYSAVRCAHGDIVLINKSDQWTPEKAPTSNPQARIV